MSRLLTAVTLVTLWWVGCRGVKPGDCFSVDHYLLRVQSVQGLSILYVQSWERDHWSSAWPLDRWYLYLNYERAYCTEEEEADEK